MDDNVLLRQFLDGASESAFEALVRQHAGMVYSVALRKTGDLNQAEDITQQVFTILAQKAASVAKYRSLAAWLHRVACYCAGKYIRDQARRRMREQEIVLMDTTNENFKWDRLALILDEELDSLPEHDRHALLLRFFEKKGIREVGDALGISEEAAKKRVARALEKLRSLFVRRGIAIGTAGLALAIQQHASAALASDFSIRILKMALGSAAAKGGLRLPFLGKTLLTNAVIFKAVSLVILVGLLSGATWHHINKGNLDSAAFKQRPDETTNQGSASAASFRQRTAIIVRSTAQKQLSPSELAECVKNLKHALNTYPSNARMRTYPSEEIVEAILHLRNHPKVVFDVLVETTRSTDPEVRHRAISAFGELRHTALAAEARSFLWPLLLSPDEETASMALGPMRNLHFQASDVRTMASLLSTTPHRMLLRYLPVAIATTAAENPNESAQIRSLVEPLLGHSNSTVRVAAACALLQPGVTPDAKVINELFAGLDSRNADWLAGMQMLMVLENAQKLGTNGVSLSSRVLTCAASTGDEILKSIAYQTAGILNPDLIGQNDNVAAAVENGLRSKEIREKLHYSTLPFDDLISALTTDDAGAVMAAMRLGEMGSAAKAAVPLMIEAMDGKSGNDKDKILEQILKIDPSVKVQKVSTLDFINAIMETMIWVANRPASEDNKNVMMLLEGIRHRNNRDAWKSAGEINRIIGTLANTDPNASQQLTNNLARKSLEFREIIKTQNE